MKKFITYNFQLLIIIIFFSLPGGVFAASLELLTEERIKTEDKIFDVTLFLNTEGEQINAVEGDINYDPSLIKVEAINIGSSFINFWLEKPADDNPGIIHFSGITPGGILTDKGEVFKVVFRTVKVGQVDLTLSNVNMYLNDGIGSLAKKNIENTSVLITNGNDGVGDPAFMSGDKVDPEKFDIVRSQDTALFDNKYFLVFSTTDKGSGVDKYKVCEFFTCVEATSPYLLKNQTPFYHIKVKAYDANGNTTSASTTSALLSILILVFIIISYLCYRYLNRVKI